MARLNSHLRDINAVAFSPDGNIMASGSSDHTIKLWRVHTQELVRTLRGHSDWVRTLCLSWGISPAYPLILISGSADQT
ncbi:WD40 repeat domain-containing protein [Capilliphycus salinus ALCB114379]|uniref:WD40 repeat domain-containing protein n=1 Tax=Capilliphycus salinus TaxID=2768948 RepID=UPI0039A56176